MNSMAGEDLIRRYVAASAADDFPAMEALRHPDWQEAWPQSGEVVTSSANYRAVRSGRPEGAPRVEPGRMGGSGETWWGEAIVHYGDGSRWLGITVFELRDGLVHRERVYFGPPVSAPEWRAPWVEREEPGVR
ncbi:MAG: nuclear transport factor 2 family protein [Chloroflexota bacterium]